MSQSEPVCSATQAGSALSHNVSYLNYCLRVFPTLTHYSGIVSDIPSGSIHGKCISADPCRQQGERVRGGITSSKGQEVITSSKGKKQENMKEEARSKKQLQATSGKKQETRSQEATSGWKTGQRSHYKQQGQEARKQERRSTKQEAITGNKRQEARNKKPGSNKRLEDRSEKQETRSQEATSGWKTGQRASFLVDSESNGRQAAGRQVKRASFLVDSESNVRQAAGRQLRELVFSCRLRKATLGTGGCCPEARSVLQGPAVLLWRGRRL